MINSAWPLYFHLYFACWPSAFGSDITRTVEWEIADPMFTLAISTDFIIVYTSGMTQFGDIDLAI